MDYRSYTPLRLVNGGLTPPVDVFVLSRPKKKKRYAKTSISGFWKMQDVAMPSSPLLLWQHQWELSSICCFEMGVDTPVCPSPHQSLLSHAWPSHLLWTGPCENSSVCPFLKRLDWRRQDWLERCQRERQEIIYGP